MKLITNLIPWVIIVWGITLNIIVANSPCEACFSNLYQLITFIIAAPVLLIIWAILRRLDERYR